MLIDKLGSKVKCHVYILTYAVDGRLHAICDNKQLAEDLMAFSPWKYKVEVWALWEYRDSYTPPIDNVKETVHYNG